MSTQSIDKFRVLFVQEAETRLARIHQLLLSIDDTALAADVVQELFREVHTIKGAAAVVGFDRLGSVAHTLEEQLEAIRSGARSLTPDVIDGLLASVDELVEMVGAALGAPPDAPPVADQPVINVEDFSRERKPVEVAAPVAARRPSQPRPTPTAIQVPVERLDDLVRLVGEAAVANLRVGRMLSERFGNDATTAGEMVDLSRIITELQERTMRTRMVPLTTITDQLRRAVRDVARTLGKDVRWEVRGADTELDRTVLQQLADSLLHLVRNAVDHGIEPAQERLRAGKPGYGTVIFEAAQMGSEVMITIRDDGRGIDVDSVRADASRHGIDVTHLSDDEALQLIFRSGISTAPALTDISGRGVGLDVVRASVDASRGRIEVHSEPGAGTELRLIVPVTMSLLPCLLVEAGGQTFAIPMHRVETVHDASVRIIHAEGNRMIWTGEAPIRVTSLIELLGPSSNEQRLGPLVVVRGALHAHAIQVDALVDQRDVVVNGVSPVLPRLDLVAGASVDADGSVLLVLDAAGLVDRARSLDHPAPTRERRVEDDRRAPVVLVVDDAVTVRELQRSILERAGYVVSVAADGVQALARLAAGDVDLVLTDVQMPRMDGFALTRAIRQNAALTNLPVVILSSLSSEDDRRHGLDAGADAFVVKSSFDETALLEIVARMLGQDR